MDFSGILLCCDYDGTLADSDGCVSYENIRAIRSFQEHGGIFTFATGRSPDFIKERTDIVPNAPIIAVNGAVLYDLESDRLLERINIKHLQLNLVEQICEHKSYNNMRIVYGDLHDAYFKKAETSDLLETLNSAVLKMVFIFDNTDAPLDIIAKFTSEHGERLNFMRSWPYSVEVLDKHAGKGNMLALLKSLLQKRISKTISVGDFDNDLSLISSADIGIAVSNAQPLLKSKASLVLEYSNNQNAISHIIEKIQQGRI